MINELMRAWNVATPAGINMATSRPENVSHFVDMATEEGISTVTLKPKLAQHRDHEGNIRGWVQLVGTGELGKRFVLDMTVFKEPYETEIGADPTEPFTGLGSGVLAKRLRPNVAAAKVLAAAVALRRKLVDELPDATIRAPVPRGHQWKDVLDLDSEAVANTAQHPLRENVQYRVTIGASAG